MEKEQIKIKIIKPFKASSEKVFDAWINSKWIGRWMFGPDVRDEEIIKLETNPVKGGSFSFVVHRGDDVINHLGTYLEIERPGRLVFTWGIEGESDGESTVTIDIVPTETGCRLTLVHELDLKWKEYTGRTKEGWSFMLEKLNSIFTSTQ